MAKAGADIVGTNCLFDPWINLETVKKMKVALDAFNLHPFLMSQPNAYRCPDCGPFGWLSLPEFPYGETLIPFTPLLQPLNRGRSQGLRCASGPERRITLA